MTRMPGKKVRRQYQPADIEPKVPDDAGQPEEPVAPVPPPAPLLSPELLRCPRCHCTDLRVYYTRKGPLHIKRARLCRHCGKQIITHERVAPQKKKRV